VNILKGFTENDTPVTVDGVRAIEIRYRAIRETDGNETAFYQSQIWLNAPTMGVLLPERYRSILDADIRCIEVFRLAFIQLLQAVKKFTERGVNFRWISIYMPLKMLMKNDCIQIISQLTEKYDVPCKKICFEIPPDITQEKGTFCSDMIKNIRECGFHVMLTGFGGIAFPVMKLGSYIPDYVMLDGGVTSMIGRSEREDLCVQSLISFVNECDAEPVAADVTEKNIPKVLSGFECLYYTGTLSGNFMAERFIRRRT
jgi:EAL domain-containing protein (putative c-di-GMP-specific phosphodiesterase class I)